MSSIEPILRDLFESAIERSHERDMWELREEDAHHYWGNFSQRAIDNLRSGCRKISQTGLNSNPDKVGEGFLLDKAERDLCDAINLCALTLYSIRCYRRRT